MLRSPLKKNLIVGLIALAGIGGQQAVAQKENDNVVHLPATSIFATENKNGRFAIMTDTGRFIIQGTLYDVWDQKEITTLEDARWAATHIPLQKADVGFSDLQPLSIGAGDKVIHLFSDVQCGHCKKIIDEARDNLPAGYRMEVILLPLLGPESTVRTAEILCAKNKAEAWKAAMSGDLKTHLEPVAANECDGDTLQKRLVTAQFLGARSVPFMIRDDGLIQEGAPAEGLRNWIQSNRKESF